MRGRAFIILSVALNIVLGAVLYVSRQRSPGPAPLPRTVRQASIKSTNTAATHVLYRKQYFNWSEVESPDYRVYIAGLQDIGCPPDTIRDIIVADVNEYYDRKRLREVVPDDPQWWKGSPAAQVAQSIARKEQALDRERRALLTQLLGPDWEPPRTQPGAMVYLTGAILGVLPESTKLAVQDILGRSAERTRQWHLDNAGEMDPDTIAAFRRRTREELAKVLSPEQLEEYLLRWSSNASQLRQRLNGHDVTPEQFRALFRATEQYEQRLAALPPGDDAAVENERARLARLNEILFQQTLGAERFEQFKLAQDPTYTQTRELADKIELTSDLFQSLYDIRRATTEESRRIREDPTLTSAEQEEALAAIVKDRADTLRELLGEERYRKLKEAEGGQAF